MTSGADTEGIVKPPLQIAVISLTIFQNQAVRGVS